MKKTMMKAVVVLLAAMVMAPAVTKGQSAGTKKLTVKVTGIRSDQGKLRAALFQAPAGFPSEDDKAFRRDEVEIKNGTATVVFNKLAPGTYAVSVLHDENGNQKMDTNFLGIPKEGYGASMNPKVRLRAPRFDEAKFELTEDAMTIEIKMNN